MITDGHGHVRPYGSRDWKRLAKWLVGDEYEEARAGGLTDRDICHVAGRRGGKSPQTRFAEMLEEQGE